MNGCPWDKYTFPCAAFKGNLENMKWLKMNECPWDEYTFYYPALKGNLENMKWLKINECPMADKIKTESSKVTESYNGLPLTDTALKKALDLLKF